MARRTPSELSWWFLLVVFLVGIFGSWWPVCGEAVRGTACSSELAVGGESGHEARGTRTGGAALPALSRKPARPSGERRRELAGSVEGPSQPRLS